MRLDESEKVVKGNKKMHALFFSMVVEPS